MVMEKRDEMEILQAMLRLLSKSLYGSGCRKLCKDQRKILVIGDDDMWIGDNAR